MNWILVAVLFGAGISGPERIDEHRLGVYTVTRDADDGKTEAYAWIVHPIGSVDVVQASDDKIVVTGKPGEYTVQLTVTMIDWEARSHSTRNEFLRILIGKAPQPPPDPEPDPDDPEPDPDDPDDPPPIPKDGLRVLIVYESSDNLDRGHALIIASKEVRDYLDEVTTKDPGGGAAYRIFDKDVNTAGDYPLWQDAMKRDRDSLPWLIISNGRTGFEGPLPHSPAAFMDLVKQYAE